jgi:threonyl-tRNA synthetase
VVGERDAAERAVSLRSRGHLEKLGSMPLERFVAGLGREISSRGAETVAARFGN